MRNSFIYRFDVAHLRFVQEIVWTRRVHLVIYGHEWGFESFQNCTSRKRVQFENFQNITSDHKSRNVRADSTKFHTQTHYFLRVTYYIKRFSGFQIAHMFYLNQSKKIMLWQANQAWSFRRFLKILRKCLESLIFRFGRISRIGKKMPNNSFKMQTWKCYIHWFLVIANFKRSFQT